MKICIKCKIEQDYINFSKDKSRNDGFSNKCKSCFKLYQQSNKEIINKINQKWSKNNREQRNKYFKNKKLTDNLFKLRCNISTLINVSLKRKNYTKKSKTFKILGCNYEEFKLHLENKFTIGMTWENAGK